MRAKLAAVVIWACALSSAGAFQGAQQSAASSQSISDVQGAVARLRATVKDPVVTEAALAKARTELQRLAEQLNKPTAASAKDVDAPGPASTMQLEVRTLLAAIDARLGPAAEPVVRSREAGFPVPQFEEGRVTHAVAAALRAAQVKLGEQIRSGAPASEELIADVILEQERLAWQAAWPFTEEETAQLRALKASQDRAKAGGKVDVAAMNDLDRRIGEFVAARRARGVAVINTQLLQEALSVGRPAPAPFIIHRPTTRSGQRLVEKRIAELIAAETGLQLQPDGPGVMLLSINTKTLDDSVLGAFRGDR